MDLEQDDVFSWVLVGDLGDEGEQTGDDDGLKMVVRVEYLSSRHSSRVKELPSATKTRSVH
jgi:hypothetical protein